MTYRKTEVDLAATLAGDLDALRGRFAAAGLDLRVVHHSPAPIILYADPHRLSQLFRNLARNSLQYTDEGGGLVVEMRREDDVAVIDFLDSPPGVPPEALPHLFERLYRVEVSRSRHAGGAGLGLAICQNIVAAHGGAIEARPAPRGGLWVHIRFPIAS